MNNLLTETNNLIIENNPKSTKSTNAKSSSNMQAVLKQYKHSIKSALPTHLNSDRFQRIVLSTFNSNKQFENCNPVTFIAAILQCAQLGLEPNTPLGQAYLIPYADQVQLQLGYQGILELCYRTNKFTNIHAYEVYENDFFDLEYGLSPKVIHKPTIKGDRGEVIGYYACYRLIDGGYGIAYMTKQEMQTYMQQYAKGCHKSSSAWQINFDGMAKKTVIKKVLKYAQKTIDLNDILYKADGAIKKDISDNMLEQENVIM